jgi:hypothetical protein
MRQTLLGLVVALGVSTLASEARAQVPFTSINDPFFAYYSFYLPRQQAQALNPGPEATINAITANRQQYAATNRTDMFDPRAQSGGFVDSGGDFLPNAGVRRRTLSAGASRVGGNLNGLGPQGRFNAANQYYPGLRTGRGRNANVAVVRSRGFSSGGFGGAGGLGLPGPR